jgi:hypothetical protein
MSVLLGQRHVVAAGCAPGTTARVRMQHQRKQAERLRLLRQQLGDEPRQVQGFVGEIAAGDIGAAGIGPAFAEGGVDGVEHGVEPAGKLGALRHGEWNPGLADLVLRAHEPLAHCRRRGEERRGDGLGVQPEHDL